jgi:hypothetical protein
MALLPVFGEPIRATLKILSEGCIFATEGFEQSII